jgi:hypothetical protein
LVIWGDDRELVIAGVRRHGNSVGTASMLFRDDEEVILHATRDDTEPVRYASQRLLDNWIFMRPLIERGADVFKYLSPRLRGSQNIVAAVLAIRGEELSKKDTIVRRGILVMMYASPEIQDDPELAAVAVVQNGYEMGYISRRLRNDPKFLAGVAPVISCDGGILRYASDAIRSNKELVLIAMSNNGYALKYASDNLKDDSDVVGCAISHTPGAIVYASSRIQYTYQHNRTH